MMETSRVSRKTMKKTGTEKTSTAMVIGKRDTASKIKGTKKW